MNYANGDSPRRLLVDLDIERRYLRVATNVALGVRFVLTRRVSEGKGGGVIACQPQAAAAAAAAKTAAVWIWISPRYSPATMEEINYVSFYTHGGFNRLCGARNFRS